MGQIDSFDKLNQAANAAASELSGLGVGQTGGGNYIQLCQKQSDVSDDALGDYRIKPGQFYLKGQDLEKSMVVGEFKQDVDGQYKGMLNCVVGPFRPKAIHLVGNILKEQSFDPADPVFRHIRSVHDSKSEPQGERFSYGVEVMLWIPLDQLQFDTIADSEYREEFRAKATEAGGILGSFSFLRTARGHALAGKNCPIGSVVKLKSVYIPPSGENKWWSPQEREFLDNTEHADTLKLAEAAIIAKADSFTTRALTGEVVEGKDIDAKRVER
jgi:hypothetical protein